MKSVWLRCSNRKPVKLSCKGCFLIDLPASKVELFTEVRGSQASRQYLGCYLHSAFQRCLQWYKSELLLFKHIWKCVLCMLHMLECWTFRFTIHLKSSKTACCWELCNCRLIDTMREAGTLGNCFSYSAASLLNQEVSLIRMTGCPWRPLDYRALLQ